LINPLIEKSAHSSVFAKKLATEYKGWDAHDLMCFLDYLVYVDEAMGLFMKGFRQSCLE
jgi:hypothetical protein